MMFHIGKDNRNLCLIYREEDSSSSIKKNKLFDVLESFFFFRGTTWNSFLVVIKGVRAQCHLLLLLLFFSPFHSTSST